MMWPSKLRREGPPGAVRHLVFSLTLLYQRKSPLASRGGDRDNSLNRTATRNRTQTKRFGSSCAATTPQLHINYNKQLYILQEHVKKMAKTLHIA